MATPAEQRKSNKRRSKAVVGGVVGGNVLATGNLVRRERQLKTAVNDFNKPRHGLGDALRIASNANRAVKNVNSARVKSVGMAAGGLVAAGATGAYNEHKYKKAKEGMQKNDSVSAFGVDHVVSKGFTRAVGRAVKTEWDASSNAKKTGITAGVTAASAVGAIKADNAYMNRKKKSVSKAIRIPGPGKPLSGGLKKLQEGRLKAVQDRTKTNHLARAKELGKK